VKAFTPIKVLEFKEGMQRYSGIPSLTYRVKENQEFLY